MAKPAADKSKPEKKPKRFKWTIRFGVALVIYTIVGFFIVPAIIKSQMLKRLPLLTHRQATVEQVKFNPYALSLTIRGFSLKEPDGEVFTSFNEFYVNFQLWASIFKWSMVFDEISLKDPFAQVTYKADGTFNFANLLTNSAPAAKPPPPPSGKPQELPAVTIYNFRITNASLSFADLNRKTTFHTQFKPIDISLTNLTTIRNGNSPYSIMARDNSGETFAWSGSVTINPLRSAGVFRLGGLRLGKYSTYANDFATFQIANGLLDIASDYRYDSATNALDLTISNAAVHLTNLELKAPETGETVLSIPNLDVTKTDASVANMTAEVGLVKSSGGSIVVRQNHDATINLLSMLILPKRAASTNAPPPVASSAAPPPPLRAKIDEIAFDNYTITAEDKKPAKPAAFKIDQLGFNIKNVSNASNAPVTASLSLRFADTGTVAVNGTATLIPPSADLQLAVSNIDLRTIQPYVEEQIKLVLTSGNVNVNGRAIYAPPDPAAPRISFTGDVAVNKFEATDDVLFKDLTKWDALNIDGIHFNMQPDKIQVDQVKLTGLSASLIVGPDRKANLQNVFRMQIATLTNNAAAATNQPAPPPAPAKPLPDVAVSAIVLENTSLHFADQSIEPHCAFDVQQFGGSIKGLSLQPGMMAVIDLNGKVDDRSPFSVSGKVSPGDLNMKHTNFFADIAVAFTNTELTAFSPYTERFAGYQLQKGKLSFGVHYLIDKKVLKAENGFYIDQFTFGAASGSPDATKLPVRLAVALLKDRHGRILLDVPLSGQTDDPKFRVGPIIWGVVVNLVEKAATSPFSLLGAAFGGGPELSFVSFQPGMSIIPDTETNKLTILAKALYERPAVSMEINGSINPELDRVPLARIKFDQQIKTLWLKEQADAGKPTVDIDQVHLETKDYEHLVKKAYKKQFGSYKPEETSTNAVTNAIVAPVVPPATKRVEEGRGASRLFDFAQSAPSVKQAKTPPAAATNAIPAGPPPPSEPELADMETQLIQKVEVTQDDFRDLMNQRAAKVQAFLLQTGKVTADRLFVTAPKPMNAASKGEDKVNLSLE